jgi:hypothetical protein
MRLALLVLSIAACAPRLAPPPLPPPAPKAELSVPSPDPCEAYNRSLEISASDPLTDRIGGLTLSSADAEWGEWDPCARLGLDLWLP